MPPLLKTEWGQSGVWKQGTPLKDNEPTYSGCTTIASAQILYYYQYQNHANNDVCYGLEHDIQGEDIENDTLCINFHTDDIRYDWNSMAWSEAESASMISSASEFIYHVGVTLNAQFGGGEGSSATARQIENAFRYDWGFAKRRDQGERSRSVKVILKDEFFLNDKAFAEHLRMEIDAGRPVMYMAQRVANDTGHAFVIDGYNSSGLFHVNWGWGGHANGYYDLSMTDPSGRSWSRNALIYQYLEPTQDYALGLIESQEQRMPSYSWNGNGSLISYASENKTGYGLTIDEAAIHPNSLDNPIVFFQWEIDSRDGTRLKISAGSMNTATITYGPWNDRSKDIRYENVSLPFILDPQADGFSVADQQYYVMSVAFNESPAETLSVVAEITSEAGSTGWSTPATDILVDGGIWNGNGSLISYTSENLKGYGLEIDEALISNTSSQPPLVFFQWEIDQQDGQKLQINADGMKGNVTYGLWNDRSRDVLHNDVSFPFVLNPTADGLSAADGEYYVIKIAFHEIPSQDVAIEVQAIQ